MYAYRRVYGVDVEVRAVAARGDHVVDFAAPAPDPDGLSQLSRPDRRRRARCHRHLHAAQSARVDDRRGDAGRQACHLRKAVRAAISGATATRQPIGKHVPKALMYERVLEEMDATRAAIEQDRQALHVCRGLDLRAGGDQDRGDPQGDQRQDPVHEGRGEPQRLACGARRAMGDDRRRLADPDGMPSAVGGALSQAGRGQGARRDDQRCQRDLRRRQRHGVPAAGGARLSSRPIRSTSRIGAR